MDSTNKTGLGLPINIVHFKGRWDTDWAWHKVNLVGGIPTVIGHFIGPHLKFLADLEIIKLTKTIAPSIVIGINNLFTLWHDIKR